MSKNIFLDHASGAPLDMRVYKTITKHLKQTQGNSSALYLRGEKAHKILEQSRTQIAHILNVLPNEILFTGSATEANNIAIFGNAYDHKRQNTGHVITTQIEHPSVLECFFALEREGTPVTYLPVNREGLINPKDLKTALLEDTRLVSIMYANNEVGTLQPIAECVDIIRKFRKLHGTTYPYLHVDACQVGLYEKFDLGTQKIDLLTLNAAKLGGPKGVGLLFVRKNIQLRPIILGGGQEFGVRSGTENVAFIAGLAQALTLAQRTTQQRSKKVAALRDWFIVELVKKIPEAHINGSLIHRIANNVHITIPVSDAETLQIYLNKQGIEVGTGSACSSGSVHPSHVLIAMGKSEKEAFQSLRITFGEKTKKNELRYFITQLRSILDLLS